MGHLSACPLSYLGQVLSAPGSEQSVAHQPERALKMSSVFPWGSESNPPRCRLSRVHRAPSPAWEKPVETDRRTQKKCVAIFILPKMLQVSLLQPIWSLTDSKTHLALWKRARSHCKSGSKAHILTKACGSQGLVPMVQHFLIPFESIT